MSSRSRLQPAWAIVIAVSLALLIKAFVLDAAIVEGPSMLPDLEPGRILLVLRCAYGLRSPLGGGYLFLWRYPEPGDVVAAESPRDGSPVVKRVGSSDGASVFLLGDNEAESLDSRHYGPVPIEALRGKVLLWRRKARP
jgi:signal peptidase I